eukprot:scaffold10003_cov117-Isochrysis_galbana.AAC.3
MPSAAGRRGEWTTRDEMKEGKEVGERGRERGEVDPPCAEQRSYAGTLKGPTLLRQVRSSVRVSTTINPRLSILEPRLL